jgi:brefeldin A-inhibited guanine nucleotide-exchange protein
MEHYNEKFNIYSENLKHIFEKIKKNLSKKHPYYNELYNICKEITDKLNADKGKELNADKYFIYMKMAMESDNLKIIEGILENMQKLIKEDLLLGNSDEPTSTSTPKKKLIDTMIDSIVKLFNNDENISLNIVKIFYSMYRNQNIKIHGESFLKMFRILIRIYLSARTPLNSDTAKTSLSTIISQLFTKMENTNSGIAFRDSALKSLVEDESFCRTTVRGSEVSSNMGIKMYTGIVYKNPLEDVAGRLLTNMVDDITLYEAKKAANEDVQTIRSVPEKESELAENRDYRWIVNPDIENEKGIPSGFFGWCIICRNRADIYCKESRYPICSIECKNRIVQDDERLAKYMNGEITTEEDIAMLYLNDCISIFKSLCKLVNTSISNTNDNFNAKAKHIALELILSLLEKPSTVFTTHKEFIKVVKDDLMEGLLKNCMSDNINIFSLSLSVFFKIWHYFREHLKQQIAVFIETVFLKILDSGNSSFQHKNIVLTQFYNLAGTPKFFVELYVNYDCDLDEKDLMQRIVTALSKIAQGKYAKSEHMLSPQQEYGLRSRALDIVTMMVRSIFLFTQDQGGINLNKFVGGEETKDNYDLQTVEDNFDDNVSVIDPNIDYKEKIDLARKQKNQIITAVEKFNLKPKNGLNYLKRIGLISTASEDEEAKDVANFLKNTHGLKKDCIGEYLGDINKVALKTLDYYTQSFDFKGTHIVEAIRQYLSGFLLPGEAQKIDRIMEKLAAKYYNDNVGIYETADIAYYIAFCTIVLNTDAHNQNVKNKMTVDKFIKMFKDIPACINLDPAIISEIYHIILNKPISLVEHEEAKEKLDSGNPKKKQDLYKKETERMYQEGSEKLRKGKDKHYLKLCEIEHVASLLESIWTVLLAMYSLVLEDIEDPNLNMLCIEGISNCIKLCGILNLDLQKEALVRGYCKLTNILQGKEIRDKHIHIIKSILQLANTDARYLRGCWKNVLELISKIDFYHMVISSSKSELETFFNEIRLTKRSQNADKEIMIEKYNMERIAKEISTDEYEIIFNKTVLLDQESIVDFVKSLCEISREELANKDSPRIFSLQKVVEVAEFNMSRIRLVWSKIWNIISEHLTEVGSNSSPVIAEKAVDSLRQLAKKFLQKDEISVYQFQKDFLKPFENILINNMNVYRTKEYVITCITNLVLAEAGSVKSGWRIIFNIFQLAAEDSSTDIIRKTFDTVVKIFENHFHQVKDNFPELAHCLKKFSNSFPEEVLSIYTACFEKLDDTNNIFAVFSCLTIMMTDHREEIRLKSTKTLFNLFEKVDRNLLSNDFWKKNFETILNPVIDSLITMKYSSTLESVLHETCELFSNNFQSLDFLLNDFLKYLVEIIVSDNESISLAGTEALKELIKKLSDNVNPEFWESIIITISDIFSKTRQTELLYLDINNFDNPEYQNKYQDTVYKNIVYCIIQHNLIELCDYILDNYIDRINTTDINYLLDNLKDSFELAYQFNIEFNLRKLISFYFMKDLNQIAALFKQQQDGISLYYKILNKMFDSTVYDKEIKINCVKKIIITSRRLLHQFVTRINFNPDDTYLITENERLINNMVPCIVDSIIPSLLKVDFFSEKEYLDDFTKVFIEMIPCNIHEIRLKVKEMISLIFEKMKGDTRASK